MKRLLRNVLTAFVVTAVGVVTASAQTWTGNTPQAGDFYLYNVGAGKFLTSGCWWGTHAALDDDGMLLTLVSSGNAYTISTNAAYTGKYLGDNAYMDNGTAATWTFTQVSTGKYTLKNGSNYLVFVSGAVADNTTTAPTTDAGYWQLVSRTDLINNMKSATPSVPVDASFFMTNPKLRRNWTNSKPFEGPDFNDNGSFNASADGLYTGGCTSVGQWHKTFDNYQALTGLPNGKYQVTVKGNYATPESGFESIPYLYANTATTNLKPMGDISGFAGGSNAEKNTRALVDDTYLTDPVTVTVTDGNLRVGVKSDGNVNWCTWREFTIKFISPALNFLAEDLPANGDMAAGKWYKVTIPVAGNNYKATATTLGNIVYTTDGTILEENTSSITEHFTATNNDLAATTYYVKSSSANNLVIEAETYTYTVGSATCSHAYVQGGETVTITYPNATTNDPGAAFAKDISGITFNGTAITNYSGATTSKGFTFTVPEVAAGSSYTLSIPANAFGYAAGTTYNAAQNITINTPALFDGTYYLRTDDYKYLSRGSSWGAHAIVDEFGEMATFTTDKDNKTSIRFFDSQAYLKKESGNNYDMYTDAGSADYWYVTLANGKYRLSHYESPTQYVKLENGILYRNGESNIVDWTLEDYATRTTRVSAYPNNNIQSVITASGAQTTVANFETYLAGLTETDLTNKIGTAKFTDAVGDWTWNEPNNRKGDQPAYGTNYIEVYEETGTLSQTITGLSEGIYKVTVDAFERIGSSDNSKRVAESSTPDVMLAYLEANGMKTRLTQWYDVHTAAIAAGKSTADNYPNGPADGVSCFNEGYCTNTVYAYVDNSGELTIKLVKPSYIGSNWLLANNFTLTLYSEDFWPAFEAAMTTYAPYSDVTAAQDATGYTTQYNTYQTYTESTSTATLRAAVTYMSNNYANYLWANASITHPVDVTDGIISGWECTINDAWPGSGRTYATGTYYDGSTRQYFTQNHENGAARSQTVTIPEIGAYLLRTIVRPVADASFATITIGSESTTTRGIQTGSANIGNNWAYNDIYFATTAANESKTISIALSNVNVGREADCGEMHLLYIGQSADFVKDGVHKYIGTFATAPAITLTDAVPVADTKAATFTSGTSTVTFTNPNGLVYANNGQVSASKNLIVSGTCASLQLADGHPFVNPTEFTATSASYTLSALADNKYATLMLPFAASAPSNTNIYVLDQDIDMYAGGTIRATAASAIEANKPVIVTKTGSYTGSGTIPVVTSGATFTNGQLVGTYTAIPAPAASFVLQKHDDTVAFYYVGETKPTVNPFRAYLVPQSNGVKSVRVIFDDEEDPTGIDALTTEGASIVEVYTAGGTRLPAPQKGLNLVKLSDGTVKKVFIK